MAATLDVTCPNCEKPLKVPAALEGKRVKCKSCSETFTIKAPAAAKKGAGDGAKPEPPPPAAEKPKSPFLDDDEDDEPGKAARPMGVVKEEDVARCPHCAKELDPPDAVVCKNCGFNNRTRTKIETKKVWAPDASDWMQHLGPGIAAALVAIGLIVFDAIAWVNMRGWLTDSFLQKDEKNKLTDEVDFYVKPGAFIALIIAISAIVVIPAVRFAIKRLAIDYKPEEKVKK